MIIENPARPEIQLVFLRAHLRLLAVGMKNSRLSGTELLRKVSAITGRAYRRGEYQIAIEDCNQILGGKNV